MDALTDAVERSRIVIVEGAPGSGKSAIVKMFFEALPKSIVPFAFKAQEFNHAHIHEFLTSMGIELGVNQLRSQFALFSRKVLLVDGAERLFELSRLDAFRHLLQELSGDNSWTVVITCREASAQDLREHLLAQWGTNLITITIPPPDG
jgi:Cdc6-like AAA superfamily ATPase